MKEIDNLTPFGYASAFAYDLDDSAVAVLCIAGSFRMPPPGTIDETQLEILDEQLPPPMADEYWSDPASSSLRSSGQGSPRRVGTEIYLRGSAWAESGRPTPRIRTSLSVGPCRKVVDVVGDRYWVRGLVDVTPTRPEPIVSLPLMYERAFGGTSRSSNGLILAQEESNPVGRGVYAKRKDAADQPLPNLESPGETMDNWDFRGIPCCYGPVPGSWQPRRRLAGTYDQEWLEGRMPLWPCDADPRFFVSAAAGLATAEPLLGGEPVLIEGMAPEGSFGFQVPRFRVAAKSVYADNRVTRGIMQLSGLLFEPDVRKVTLYWSRSVPLGHGAGMHLRSIVRLLERWEEVPV